MAISVDNQQRLGHFGLDASLPYSNSPHFTNPWAATSSAAQSSQYMSPTSSQLDAMAKQQAVRANNVSLPYSSIPVSAPDMMAGQRLSNASSYDTGYASASSPSAFATSTVTSAPYSSMGYVTAQNPPVYGLPQVSTAERRMSHPNVADPYQDSQRQRENSLTELNKGFAVALQSRDFGDATLDAGRGMVAMSQNTPRNLYESRVGRSTNDYFPVTHSATSSISSGSYNPSYYAGSVDSSTDYSSAAESVDSHTSRTLPRPNGLLNGNVPPAPSSMMGQFSSKVSTSSQKKHKCKVCDKRFTRPSSLQTHMYSHTGEKPYSCDVAGCGRHFSVVSNLRRHRKVHKGDTRDNSEDF